MSRRNETKKAAGSGRKAEAGRYPGEVGHDRELPGTEAARAYGDPLDWGHVHADPLGSYTGIVIEGTPFDPPEMTPGARRFERPVQDADDL